MATCSRATSAGSTCPIGTDRAASRNIPLFAVITTSPNLAEVVPNRGAVFCIEDNGEDWIKTRQSQFHFAMFLFQAPSSILDLATHLPNTCVIDTNEIEFIKFDW